VASKQINEGEQLGVNYNWCVHGQDTEKNSRHHQGKGRIPRLATTGAVTPAPVDNPDTAPAAASAADSTARTPTPADTTALAATADPVLPGHETLYATAGAVLDSTLPTAGTPTPAETSAPANPSTAEATALSATATPVLPGHETLSATAGAVLDSTLPTAGGRRDAVIRVDLHNLRAGLFYVDDGVVELLEKGCADGLGVFRGG
jgi:hypothetical protein